MGGLIKRGNPSKKKKLREPRDRREGEDARVVWQGASTKQRLFAEFGGRCAICECAVRFTKKQAANQATIDHIIPLSRGGSGEYENLQLACFECNNLKGGKLPSEFARMLLLACAIHAHRSVNEPNESCSTSSSSALPA